MKNNHFDVLIIGAGVSGVGVACQLSEKVKGKSFAILERREAMGGTWDLFKYPGIRSDSDMYTFGYGFRPWNGTTVLASGPAIKQYVIDTAKEYGVDKKINYGLKVVRADFDSAASTWTVEALHEKSGEKKIFTASFVINSTGYYNYDKGYTPEFKDKDKFKGEFIHPQHWPEDLDYSGKKVVVIGSGATAITLVPAMAPKVKHITMLQRSPTYIVSVPSEDFMSAGLNKFLPRAIVYQIGRARNIFLQKTLFWLCKQRPSAMRSWLLKMTKSQLSESIDMKHFTPDYKPWDERLCVVPDGDLFKAVNEGKASIVTEHIDRFTETGIQLKNGEHLEADIIVSATGLDVRIGGGAVIHVDGKPVDVNQKLTYKGVLLEDVPNAAIIFGYTNASWTLKVDIAAEYICRLLNYMDAKKYKQVLPVDHEGCKTDENVMGLQSGYLQRAKDRIPRQGTRAPWRVENDYLGDIPVLRFAPIADGILEFRKEGKKVQQPPQLKVVV